MATLSVADCERKHGDHKRLGSNTANLSFVSLLTNSINDEARHNLLRCQKHAQKLRGRARISVKRKIGVVKVARSSNSAPTTRSGWKASPLLLFRQSYIASQKKSESVRNWVAKEAWEDVKRAFNLLSDDQKQHYEKMASALNKQRFLSKNKSKLKQQLKPKEINDLDRQPTEQTALANLELPAVFNGCLCCPDPAALKDHMASVDGLFGHMADEFRKCAGSQQLNPWPVEESNVLATLVSLKGRGMNCKDAVKHYSTVTGFFAGPKPGDEPFPNKVTYHQSCRGVCVNQHGFTAVQFQTKVIDSLHKMARTLFKKPSDLIREDMLLGFESSSTNVITRTKYFLVSAVAFRGGVQKPAESYVKLDARTERPSGDVFLHL